MFAIRPYHPSDMPALYRICLRTGSHGKDASGLYRDPDLLGHYYAAPYAFFEPDLCFVLTCDRTPCGYVLGTRNSPAFRDRCERDWFPFLQQRYPVPQPDDTSADAQIIYLIHADQRANGPLEDAYPAHLHIDLLPEGQGQGWGRKLMQAFLDRLRDVGVRGVHLGVSQANPGAIAFYERVGFQRVEEHPTWIAFGMRLAER